MKRISAIILVLIFSYIPSNAATRLTVTPNPTFSSFGIPDTATGTAKLETQFEENADKNGPIYSDAFSFANIIGYPVGSAYIGSFPHFELGVAAGVGMTNMEYYKENSTSKEEGKVPGYAPAINSHFGIGIGQGFDVLGKALYMNLNVYDPKINQDTIQLNKFSMYSFGGKLRYNWIDEFKVIPFLLSFDGLTFSLGGDFMSGNINVGGKYEYNFNTITIDPKGSLPDPPAGYTYPTEVTSMTAQDLTTKFFGKYVSDLKWYNVSTSAQAIAYFDIVSLFTFYTGLGVSVGYGWVDMEFDGVGDLKVQADQTFANNVNLATSVKNAVDSASANPPKDATENDKIKNYVSGGCKLPITYTDINNNTVTLTPVTSFTTADPMGTVALTSSNKYNPYPFIPTYIVGAEINLWLLKITAESQVNLKNRQDLSVLAGVRLEF